MTHIVGNLRFKKEFMLGYLNNPKVACGTIKNSMLGGDDVNVHKKSAFDAIDSLADVEIFSVVRNPFTRALSGYLQKFTGKKEAKIWEDFSARYGINPDQEITFKEFLKCLSRSSSLKDEDHHFRPQVYNLHEGYITPSFIGRFEDFESIKSYLEWRKVAFIPRVKAQTGSSQKLHEYYDYETEKLVVEVFKDDFETYGYSKSLQCNEILPPIIKDQWVSGEIMLK